MILFEERHVELGGKSIFVNQAEMVSSLRSVPKDKLRVSTHPASLKKMVSDIAISARPISEAMFDAVLKAVKYHYSTSPEISEALVTKIKTSYAECQDRNTKESRDFILASAKDVLRTNEFSPEQIQSILSDPALPQAMLAQLKVQRDLSAIKSELTDRGHKGISENLDGAPNRDTNSLTIALYSLTKLGVL